MGMALSDKQRRAERDRSRARYRALETRWMALTPEQQAEVRAIVVAGVPPQSKTMRQAAAESQAREKQERLKDEEQLELGIDDPIPYEVVPGVRTEILQDDGSTVDSAVLARKDIPPGCLPSDPPDLIQRVLAYRRVAAENEKIFIQRARGYGKDNILAQGLPGVTTRLVDDKGARLKTAVELRHLRQQMRDIGVPAEIIESKAPWTGSSEDDSLADTLSDISVYAIIGSILLRGEWPK